MTIWHCAYFYKIEEVELERETQSFVIVGGHRYAKNSDYRWYRPTREEAKSAVVAYQQAKVNRARLELEYAENQLQKAQSL